MFTFIKNKHMGHIVTPGGKIKAAKTYFTIEETQRANLQNAAHAAIKLLQHLGRAHGHHFHAYEQQAIEQLVSGATCNEGFDLLSEEYFNHIISPVIYPHGK